MAPAKNSAERGDKQLMHCENHETWLEHYRFEKYVLDLCIATVERGGVTSNVRTRQLHPAIDAWSVPKYPEKTLILPPGTNLLPGITTFIQKNRAALYLPDSWLGTWINPFTRCCHLDITEIYVDLDEARNQALQRKQVLALYNFKHNQTIYLHAEPDVLDEMYILEKML